MAGHAPGRDIDRSEPQTRSGTSRGNPDASQASGQGCRSLIARLPAAVQVTPGAMRQTIRTEVPSAEETISYRIPTFKLNGSP